MEINCLYCQVRFLAVSSLPKRNYVIPSSLSRCENVIENTFNNQSLSEVNKSEALVPGFTGYNTARGSLDCRDRA